jgi:ferredoxin
MIFVVLMSLLLILIISAIAFFYCTYTNHKSKEYFSDTESTFLSHENDFEDEGKVAVVKCSSSREYRKEKLQHSQMIDCRMFLDKYGFSDFCKYGCLGYGTCVTSCPEKAIILVNNTAVVNDGCTGCGICVDKCPQKIIELVNLKESYYKQESYYDYRVRKSESRKPFNVPMLLVGLAFLLLGLLMTVAFLIME